jgi:ubiquinol-cytochrome c reductase iron-sulfur subunit
VTTRESAPGSTGGADVPGPLHGGPDDDYTPEQLATMSREDLDLLGARYDSVQVLHVDPGPEPGSSVERQAVRQVALTFGLAGLAAFAAFVIYVGSGWFLPDWQWTITEGGWSAIFTPMIGALGGLALILVGVGMVLFTKKLLPHETAVQDKHDGSHFDRVTTGATLVGGLHNSGLARRKLITRSVVFMGGGIGLMLLMPLGGLIRNPNTGNPLGTTSWGEGVRLLRVDGSPIRPGDQQPGSLAPHRPGGLRLRRLRRLLQDLHARRLPGVAVRAGDQPHPLSVSPVAVRRDPGRQAGLRPGDPPSAAAADHGRRRGLLRCA